MLLEDLKAIYLREVATLERELDLYPNDESVWKELPGLPNSAGTLILHVAGSLQHFFGATLGNTGYVRNREAEFSKRDVPRIELQKELEAARAGVNAGFANVTEARLSQPFPNKFTDTELSTQLTLLQFLSHLAYHLGQIDYHRRVVTGSNVSANAVSASELVKR
jgi:DinB superfamily